MTNRVLSVLAAVAFLTAGVVTPARADVRRQTTARRPYITEIGEPYSISLSTVRREAYKMSELREYLDLYGEPDYAEVQEIEPEWPWESYEVRLYYMRRNLETDFGHVFISSAMPNFGVLKYQGRIPPDKRHEIEVILQARQAPLALPLPKPPAPAAAKAARKVSEKPTQPAATGGLTEAVVVRIETAAQRASIAADHAAEASEAAVRAADRTTNIVDKMEENAAP